MKISIVVPTLNRKDEVYALLQSLRENAGEIDFEVIIVDQNRNGLLNGLAKFFNDMSIRHYVVDFVGLSQARNFGILKSQMPYIFFADDDMKFIFDSLNKALNFLEENDDFVAIAGRMVDGNGDNSVGAFARSAHELDVKKHFYGYFVESSMLFRKDIFASYQFDENLGVGRFHGAEEGADLILNLLKMGKRIYYDPEIKYYHPAVILSHESDAAIKRVFFYRAGFALFCIKNHEYSRLIKRIFKVMIYLCFLTFIFSGKRRYYFAELLGLFSGIVIR